MNEQKTVSSAKTLTKSNVWKLSENDVVTILENAAKEIDVETQLDRVVAIIRMAFDVENIDVENELQKASLQKRGFQIVQVDVNSSIKLNWAIKKHPVSRVTDLTYQNVTHLSADKVLGLIESNFGGGWESLSQSVKDVILSAFHVTSTSMPKSRNIEDSALYKKKKEDGYSVLQVEKGSWVEVIFAKSKGLLVDDEEEEEEQEHIRRRRIPLLPTEEQDDNDENGLDEEEEYEEDTADEDDEYSEEELTAESYRTVIEEEPDDLDVDAIDEDEEEY